MSKKTITDYWKKRRELEDAVRLVLENQLKQEIISVFPEALKEIQEKLLSQASLHNISITDLLTDFSSRDEKQYRQYIDNNYKQLMESDEKYQEFIDEYFPPYDYAKVNRLLQIRSDIFSILSKAVIDKDIDGVFRKRLEAFVNTLYTSNSKALAYILGGDYHNLPADELHEMLNYPWSGKTFSSRLWGNISRLEQNLSQAIVNAVSSGEGFEDALKRMRGTSEITEMFLLEQDKFKNAIENLVRTEYAHFAVTGIEKSFESAGIETSISWSAEDERVCTICGSYHNKTVDNDKPKPPYHSRCRCTLIPKIPDLDENIDKIYEEMFGDLLNEFASGFLVISVKG
jgi:SPP1 gp7 family putative phage head morphogenesis protein